MIYVKMILFYYLVFKTLKNFFLKYVIMFDKNILNIKYIKYEIYMKYLNKIYI